MCIRDRKANAQKYADRIARLRQALQLHERNVESLKRELGLSLIHISEPTRLLSIPYAVFCLKKKTSSTIRETLVHQYHIHYYIYHTYLH